jgi:hypothetical protein
VYNTTLELIELSRRTTETYQIKKQIQLCKCDIVYHGNGFSVVHILLTYILFNVCCLFWVIFLAKGASHRGLQYLSKLSSGPI